MYKFDVTLSAKTSMKERLVWMLYLGITFFLLYGSANQYAGLTAPHNVFVFEWEKNIPFIEAFIIPYMFSDLMFVFAFFLAYTRLELRVLALRIFFIVSFSVLMFLLFPLQFSFEKPEAETFTFLFTVLQADLPFNQAPSLHVSFSIVLWFSMASQIKSAFLKGLLAIWFTSIALSTLFVYQHHFIDLPTGALVGFLAVYFISEKKENSVLKAFMTPRSLKMALYYLVGAIVFVLLAFNISVFFVYIALSLFLVSVIYAFGLNGWLTSSSLTEYFLKYALFAPYILGNTLSWFYYKRKIPLMTEVKENVYFGRLYDAEEGKSLKEKNIKNIINLATEHFLVKVAIEPRVYNLPFLDQIIPSPELLHKAVLLIEEHKKEPIYIHCALGLSRSVLVVSAWLLYTGHDRDEVEEIIKRVRPNYVKSAYMGIALDIYTDYRLSLKKGK
ncbi:MAG: Ser/Thr and Tyr protein phosphatase (dual specificity) [uncultured Sulfurovum sp.]|uniref:Ser/Thr and Tyr protein phosphatase (Dual specificity) n=1 Tax=uncultured Sulfurovum sp. TaxID=269237 RepID=A0A6S6SJT7_9BACT|nr:MAG: Ser/Thr and Tyr protein phosphatase (dual specificity) [uncultured Sulfurovum sp.]